jgi:hypothetical protein|tara:strand:+ start:2102 stop:2872 length:771 start_codon:yes stop_codon:yes gene_type:complete
MRNKPKLNQPINGIKTNMLWHRRLGLSTFVVLIFLAISGFALNHSPGLKLNQINLSTNWLLSWYGFEVPAAEGFEVRESWFYNDGNKRLLVDGNSIAPCTAPLSAVAQTANSVFALCADGLILLTADGEFVEQFRPIDGLPANTKTVATIANRVYLITDSATVEFNPESLALISVDIATLSETLVDSQLASAPLPKSLQKQLKEQASGPSISLETLILDLHSGRFFGQFGVLFIDLIGLLVCILSITGLMAWIKRR